MKKWNVRLKLNGVYIVEVQIESNHAAEAIQAAKALFNPAIPHPNSIYVLTGEMGQEVLSVVEGG